MEALKTIPPALVWGCLVVFTGIFAAYGQAPVAASSSEEAATEVVFEAAFSGKPVDPSKPVVVRVASPALEEVLGDNEVDVFLEVENYALAEGGNRLHVILDNDSPLIVSDTRKPLTLKSLSEGGHSLRIFAVAPDGRPLSNPESYNFSHFFVRRRDFANFVPPGRPYLTLHVPVNGVLDIAEGERVWLDFRVRNAALGKDGYGVRYSINGVGEVLRSPKPIFWNNLKPGQYTLQAELVDSVGQPVEGIFNRVERVFTIRATQKASVFNAPETSRDGNEGTPSQATSSSPASAERGEEFSD